QQFLPVAWTPDNRPHALPTLAGDPDGAATAINQQGQIVGITGKCDNAVGRFSAIHAVMWDEGRVIDMGNIGGNAWNTPMDMNDRGEAVGFADLSGDPTGNNPTFHAFFWARGQAMVDLGTLPGDAISEALGINNRGEIVGLSFGAGFSHPQAVIWIHGQIFNLNSMVSNGSTMNLIDAQEINDRGEITGQGVDTSGNTPAFLLVPDDDD
ncbi:MAG TPA: hypothetical protein VGS99_04605, partial [Gammaproteobacteria bacterium]|nr:hypothetical protein [Gammaproteobacteria bacterium]